MNNQIYGTVSVAALVAANVAWAGSPEPFIAVPLVVASVTDSPFDGFYVGAAVASATGDIDETLIFSGGRFYDTFSNPLESVGGTVFAGYNYAPSAIGFVYGGEIAYGMPNATFPGAFVISENASLDSLLTLHGRVGYASGPLMYYGMVGYAAGGISCDTCDGNLDGTVSGYVAGAGVEYMITDNLSFRGQYEHFEKSGAEGFIGTTYDSSVELNANVMSVGLSYHF